MVNLFRLLGLPNPNLKNNLENDEMFQSNSPNPQAGDMIIHLSENRISEWTNKMILTPTHKVIYLKPDNLRRLNLIGMDKELINGNLLLFNLKELIHMPSQTAKCSREIRQLAENNGVNVFALNESDTLLMVPGLNMRVDTHKHILGLSNIT